MERKREEKRIKTMTHGVVLEIKIVKMRLR
jgi:hypothetical protein